MKAIFLVTGLLALGMVDNAKAGGVDGGGGKSIVCRNAAGEITSAETLDLYEGRIMFGKNIAETAEPMVVQIETALNQIPANSRGLIEIYVNLVRTNMKITPPGTKLLPIDDSFEVIVPKDCSAEQAANYYSDKLILISGDIWTSLTETGKAALILHEAIYASNRLVGATNSRQSRHIVANIFDPSTRWVDIKRSFTQSVFNLHIYGRWFVSMGVQRPE